MNTSLQERLEAILASPSYRLAEEDVELLQRDELRPTRVQLELLKCELGLKNQKINSTIVVFGGTQVVEREPALERLQAAKRLTSTMIHASLFIGWPSGAAPTCPGASGRR